MSIERKLLELELEQVRDLAKCRSLRLVSADGDEIELTESECATDIARLLQGRVSSLGMQISRAPKNATQPIIGSGRRADGSRDDDWDIA